MTNKSYKMLTPERIALLLLAIILMTWAIFSLSRRSSTQSWSETVIPDTANSATKDDAKMNEMIDGKDRNKENKRNERNKRNKKRGGKNNDNVHRRDHLREPIEIE